MNGDRFTITTGVSGDAQESNFMNATLNVVGDLAVSIAVKTPDHMEDMSEEEIVKSLREDLKPLTDIGYLVEVQIGPEQENDDD